MARKFTQGTDDGWRLPNLIDVPERGAPLAMMRRVMSYPLPEGFMLPPLPTEWRWSGLHDWLAANERRTSKPHAAKAHSRA